MKLSFSLDELSLAKQEEAMLFCEFENMWANLPRDANGIDWSKVEPDCLFITRISALSREAQRSVLKHLQVKAPYDLSSFGFVGLFLGFMVADDAVRSRFLDLDSRWGSLFNNLNPHLDSDLESIWTHGSVTGLTIALSIFMYDKVKREWSSIKANKSMDWTIPLSALGLTAAAANAYDTHQVIQGAEPVVGLAIDNTLAKLGYESGLEPRQTNVAYEVSVAVSVALFNYLNAARRKALSVKRREIPLTREGVLVLRNQVVHSVNAAASKFPPEALAVPNAF